MSVGRPIELFLPGPDIKTNSTENRKQDKIAAGLRQFFNELPPPLERHALADLIEYGANPDKESGCDERPSIKPFHIS